MGGNRTPQPPKPFQQQFPGDEVRGIIDDAGTKIKSATKTLEKKGTGFRSDSEANQVGLGVTPAGQNTVTKTRPVSGDEGGGLGNQMAQDFLKNQVGEDKQGDYKITSYNNKSDFFGDDRRMFDQFQNVYEDAGQDYGFGKSGGTSLEAGFKEAKKQGYISSTDDYSLDMAKGFNRFLGDKLKKDFPGQESSMEEYEVDAGANTLTGRTMSQAMGDYRDNYQNVIGNTIKESKDYIKNYEAGLLRSNSVEDTRTFLGETSNQFRDRTDKYRESAYNMLGRAADKATGMIDVGRNQALDTQNRAYQEGIRQIDRASGVAANRATRAADRGRQESMAGYANAANRVTNSAAAGYGTALYNTARQNFGNRADEGYSRYQAALDLAGRRGRTFSQTSSLNMLRDATFQRAAAGPPTLRMQAQLQNDLRQIAGYGGYGGQGAVSSRGNIRPDLTTSYNFGFGSRDAAGNYRRTFDRTTNIANNANPFYSQIRSSRFNFDPGGSRQNYGFTPGTNFESRSRGRDTQNYYNRFLGGYSPRG